MLKLLAQPTDSPHATGLSMVGFFAATLILALTGVACGSFAANNTAAPSEPAVVVRRSDASGIRLSIDVPEHWLSQSLSGGASAADESAWVDAATTTTPGFPKLPMVVRTVLLPPVSGVQLTIQNLDSRTGQDFIPSITPLHDDSTDPQESAVPCNAYLSTSGFWSPEPIVVSKPAILRGRRLVQVTFYPIQVNPATGEVRYNDNADFELLYSGEGDNPVIDPSRPRPSSNIDAIISSMVVNPPLPTPKRDDMPGRGSYMLVYYNTNGVADALAPLIAWRKRQGWNVVAAGFNANTSAQDIKRRIQDQYNGANPPEMIALVGDPDWGGVGVPPWDQTTDQGYALLEGNDILADADYGRISAGSLQELDRVVAKIVNYESNPYMDDVEWYHNGAVCAGDAQSGISTVFINKWIRREALDRTWTDVAEWYFNDPEGNVPQFYHEQFSRGINFITYRGFVNMSGVTANDIMNYQATRRYPFATIITCATGSYVGTFGNSEAMFRSPGGAIGAVGLHGPGTHTPYNNIVLAGIWAGIFKHHLYNLGTACNYGRFELWRQYAGFENDVVTRFTSWMNLMGDPATEMWTDTPQLIDATYDAELPVGASRVTVVVTDHTAGTPITGANVCLFKEENNFQMVVLTGDNGVAEFAIPPDALAEGDRLLVTVTKHNVKPHLGSITVGQAEQNLGVESWEVTEDADNDGIANPGEALRLRMQLRNFGNSAPEGALTITGESQSRWATVDAAEVRLDQSPAAGESTSITFPVQMDSSAPDREIISITVTVHSGEIAWSSVATVEVTSPKIEITEFHLPNNRFNPGEVISLDVTMTNTGNKRLDATEATLWSETGTVMVIDNVATYDALDPGASSPINGRLFRIRSNPLTIPGSKAVLKMAVESERGFRDTTSATITIGQLAETDPFGPDDYGYVCFDSGDTSWAMHPVYDWIEIDPNAQEVDFEGTFLNLRDEGEDQDRSAVVDLPFGFQYYGRRFDRLTINTNGWAAFGDWSELADFRNRRIGSCEGPDAQLCVFWDDLTTGRILTCYDEARGRFIVEWNEMHCLSDASTEAFQLILHDVRTFPTYSGDGIITYQYKRVRNPNSAGPSNDTPFATVGMGNLDDTGGLEYTYYNTYTPGAKQLADNLAIKFTTAIVYITGVVTGQITDAETGAPLQRAELTTPNGFWAESDSAGRFTMNDVLIGEYASLTVGKQGYNDSTWRGPNGQGFSIAEDETLTVNFALLHPDFNIDAQRFDFWMLKDSTTTAGFNLTNNGNGPLWFNSRYSAVLDQAGASKAPRDLGPIRLSSRDEPDDQWDMLLNFNLSEQLDGNLRMQSIVYVNDHWFIAGGHSGQADNHFYEFTKDGRYTGVSYLQPVGGLYGIRDMEYYDGYVYGAYLETSTIYKLDPSNGHEVAHWPTPRGFSSSRNITIDPATGHFWMSGSSNRLYEYELVGDSAFVEVHRFPAVDPRTNMEMHKYGISWFSDDPDGFNLYLISSDEVEHDPSHANIALFKMNPLTGEIQYLTDLPFLDSLSQGRGGMTITSKWNSGVYALAAVIDHESPSGDYVGVFELAPNSSWIQYTPHSDTLAAGQRVAFEISISTADLDTGRYRINLEFHHNARGGITRLPITLYVRTNLQIDNPGDPAQSPFDYSLAPVWPNPFNAKTFIHYSLRDAGKVRLEVFDVNGRLVSTLLDDEQAAGRYRIAFDGEGLAAGTYLLQMKVSDVRLTRKIVLLK